MLRLSKIFLWMMGCLLVGVPSAHSFSLLGPGQGGGAAGDAWQTPDIGYGYAGSGQIGQPKNINEEYRWNVPVIYYACDGNFMGYFGSNGVAAVDAAFAILNNTFTNGPGAQAKGVDGFSSDLSEFPLTGKQENFAAEALLLLDVKSTVLSILVEELGLADPNQYVWALRERDHITPGPSCPQNMNYLIVKRNFDPVTFLPSSYVNGTLYTYIIQETCNPPNPIALAAQINVDPLADTSSTIASAFVPVRGEYFTSLTRDDAGALRYLLRTNNVNTETPPGTATVFTLVTNLIPSLTTFDFGPFLSQLSSTDPNTLLGRYPGLQITSVTTNYFLTNSSTTVLFLTNYPWFPAGFGPALVQANQSSQYFATNYSYTFGNIVTNHYYTNWSTTTKLLQLTFSSFSVPPNYFLVTNTLSSTTVKGPGGDFYILPPNVIGYIFGSQVITNKGITNIMGQIISVDSSHVNFFQTSFPFTNYTYGNVKVIQLQQTAAGGAAKYQGVEKMTFVRRDFDDLIGQTWTPVTNTYTINVLSGSLIPQVIRRVVSQPDFLFTMRDIPPFVVNGNITPQVLTRSVPNYNQANISPGLAGPGTLGSQVIITFNTQAPVYYNTSAFLGETTVPSIVYGSFDGTTNPPVVYPDSTSLQNLENQIFLHVTSTTLPDGTNNVAYNGGAGFQLTGSGGTPPYSWQLATLSALPSGLSLSSDGIISGTPATVPATYDFIVEMTDGGARTIQQSLSIIIHP